MKVYVVCHGLFGVVEPPSGQNFVEAVFLDAAGWKDPAFHIPKHDLFVRYTDSAGKPQSLPPGSTGISLGGMRSERPKIDSKPLDLTEILSSAAMKADCAASQSGNCKLDNKPLIRARLKLQGGKLENCEFDLFNGIDTLPRQNTWGSQHIDFEWDRADGTQLVRKTFNAVLFTYEAEGTPELQVGGHDPIPLGKASPELARRFGRPNEEFALVIFNNTVPKSSAQGHFHVDPNRDLHSLLFHELLQRPLAVSQRPVPRARLRSGSPLEAPPLNRCIPYTYQG